MSNFDLTEKGVPFSSKTGQLRKTLGELSIKNLQAMKLMNEKFRLIDQMGRRTKGRTQAGDANMGGMYQLGSARSTRRR